MSDDATGGEGITRREALKRGAAVAGAVWAVPAMQVLNMSAAHAEGDGENGVPSPTGPTTTTTGDAAGQWGD